MREPVADLYLFTALILVVAILWPPSVQAYRPGGQTSALPTTTAFNAGVASAQAIAADPQRSSMQIYNSSSSNTCFLSHGTAGPAAMNAAGSIPLGPLANWVVDNTRDVDSINVICSGANTPITILTWK